MRNHPPAMLIEFRPLARGDFPLLSQWLAEPHVKTWWREDHDPPAIEAKYGPCVDGREPTEVFVVDADRVPIGLIQRYRVAEYPDWERAVAGGSAPPGAVGIDYLIGVGTLLGRGLGSQIIDRFVQETWSRYPDVSAIVVDVLQANRRSWRALEKAGFEQSWAGTIDSDDPSDAGPSYLYLRHRPAGNAGPVW